MKPHVTGPIGDVRFVDSAGCQHSFWDAAHNASSTTRQEFDEWARRIYGREDWCAFLFGPDQHGERFNHKLREWVPA